MPDMKAHTEYITLTTKKRYEMVHLTPQIEAIVERSGIVDGLCFVSPMHITAAIYVNDNESGLIEDISTWLEKLAPAWPANWTADFKLNAPHQTVVTGHVENGQITKLKTVPASRAKDVVIVQAE